jgi:hypothetical protein
MVNEHVPVKPVDGAFLQFAASVAQNGVDSRALAHKAARASHGEQDGAGTL